MKKSILIMTLMLFFVLTVPTQACTIKKTSNSEYYLYMWREPGNEEYEGLAPLYPVFEEAGYDMNQMTEEERRAYEVQSSNEKVLYASSSFVRCKKPGDAKVSVKCGETNNAVQFHVFDVTLKKVKKGSKKAIVKAKGNLKGCKVILRIGGKNYKKKITKKNQKITFRIGKTKKNRKILVRLLKGKKELLRFRDVVR